MSYPRPRAKLKKGNIFLVLVLILALVYYFNQAKIQPYIDQAVQYLEEQGYVAPATTQDDVQSDVTATAAETPTEESTPPKASRSVDGSQPLQEVTGSKRTYNKEYNWTIKAQYNDTLYIGKDNLLEINVENIDPLLLRPKISGNLNDLRAESPKEGRFIARVRQPGKTKIELNMRHDAEFVKVGTKEFVVVRHPSLMRN